MQLKITLHFFTRLPFLRLKIWARTDEQLRIESEEAAAEEAAEEAAKAARKKAALLPPQYDKNAVSVQ